MQSKSQAFSSQTPIKFADVTFITGMQAKSNFNAIASKPAPLLVS
jgi:hypothetical protein